MRDWLLGLEPKDFDIEVAGATYETLVRALAPFGATDLVGRSFGIIKLRRGGAEYDFSLPRRESKTGAGHRGFAVAPDPALTDAEAAARRDFTINAIAYDPLDGTVIDPHGGQADLRARDFCATPARLRGGSAAGPPGDAVCGALRFDPGARDGRALPKHRRRFHELPVERVWGEWEKWAVKSTAPSRGLAVLEQTGWLGHFPEIAALAGVPQEPEWHPEGDVLATPSIASTRWPAWPSGGTATRRRRRYLMFAVLAHDFGKPSTTVRTERRGALALDQPRARGSRRPPDRGFSPPDRRPA